jgi:hypothetical protein
VAELFSRRNGVTCRDGGGSGHFGRARGLGQLKYIFLVFDVPTAEIVRQKKLPTFPTLDLVYTTFRRHLAA